MLIGLAVPAALPGVSAMMKPQTGSERRSSPETTGRPGGHDSRGRDKGERRMSMRSAVHNAAVGGSGAASLFRGRRPTGKSEKTGMIAHQMNGQDVLPVNAMLPAESYPRR